MAKNRSAKGRLADSGLALGGYWPEPALGRGAKEDPRKENQKCAVNGELQRLVNRESDVEDDPDESQPARPVVAAEQKDAGDDGEEFSQLSPHSVRLMREQPLEMRGESDNADRQVQAGEEGNGKWASAHLGSRVQDLGAGGIGCTGRDSRGVQSREVG